jgi:hypothetical protein
MSTLPIYFTVNYTPPQYKIDWNFTTDAYISDLQILVNGTQVVYATSNNAGFFFINPGDYVQANTNGTPTYPLLADAYLYVYDSVNGVLYESTNTAYFGVSNTYGPYYPSGDGEITANIHEY